jgi:hypothetical protein
VVAGQLAADPALLHAVATWWSAARNFPAPAAAGTRETALLDCRSGRVNFTVTHGWCYVSQLKLFYNISDRTFIDPRTGLAFRYDPSLDGFFQANLEVDELPGAPPVLRLPPGTTPPPISTHCSAQQSQLIAAHIQGLNQNAARTDSPPMRALFTQQAQWWQGLCTGS